MSSIEGVKGHAAALDQVTILEDQPRKVENKMETCVIQGLYRVLSSFS